MNEIYVHPRACRIISRGTEPLRNPHRPVPVTLRLADLRHQRRFFVQVGSLSDGECDTAVQFDGSHHDGAFVLPCDSARESVQSDGTRDAREDSYLL